MCYCPASNNMELWKLHTWSGAKKSHVVYMIDKVTTVWLHSFKFEQQKIQS